MRIFEYETKMVECEKCGWVGTIAKFIPLKLAWCGGCRSSRIRLYKSAPNKSLHADSGTGSAKKDDPEKSAEYWCTCTNPRPVKYRQAHCSKCGGVIPPY